MRGREEGGKEGRKSTTYNRRQQEMKRQERHRINLDMTPQLMHLQPALVVDIHEPLLRDGGEGFVVEEADVPYGFVEVEFGVEGGGLDVEDGDVAFATGEGEMPAEGEERLVGRFLGVGLDELLLPCSLPSISFLLTW